MGKRNETFSSAANSSEYSDDQNLEETKDSRKKTEYGNTNRSRLSKSIVCIRNFIFRLSIKLPSPQNLKDYKE